MHVSPTSRETKFENGYSLLPQDSNWFIVRYMNKLYLPAKGSLS